MTLKCYLPHVYCVAERCYLNSFYEYFEVSLHFRKVDNLKKDSTLDGKEIFLVTRWC